MSTTKESSKKAELKPVIRTQSAAERGREIWLAGLGAFSVAQTQGKKVFESMVAEGAKLEESTRKSASNAANDVRSVVEGKLSLVKETAGAQFSRLERVFEDRVSQVLARLGVPSKDDVQTLSKRVAELSKEIKSLSQSRAA